MDFSSTAQQWVNVVLIWVGFGTLAGLIARAFLPIGQPSGPVATLVLGIVGSMLGLLTLTLVLGQRQPNPISPLGFLVASGGALMLLIAYRIAWGYFGGEVEKPQD